jgi:hypothetical protein
VTGVQTCALPIWGNHNSLSVYLDTIAELVNTLHARFEKKVQ